VAKIVLFYGDHPEETRLARHRALQAKGFLEARGHAVEVVRWHNPASAQAVLRLLKNSSSEHEAHAKLTQLAQRMAEQSKVKNYSATSTSVLARFVSTYPQAHVFSFHAQPVLEPPAAALAALGFDVPTHSEGCEVFEHAVTVAPSYSLLEQNSRSEAFSYIYAGVATSVPEPRACGIVENRFYFRPQVSRDDAATTRVLKFLQSWLLPAKATAQAREAAAWIKNIQFNRTRSMARVITDDLKHPRHAQAIADRIHDLVVKAENKGIQIRLQK